MSTLIQAKQISKNLIAPLWLTGVAVAAGGSVVISNATLAAALGATPPVQAQNTVVGDPRGFVVSGNNLVSVWNTATKAKLFDATDNEIYARLTLVAGAYTVSFYSLVAGVETAYTFAAAQTLDLILLYQFDFNTLPVDALVTIPERYVDPSEASGVAKEEVLAVTAVNTLAAVSVAPNVARPINLFVNGQVIDGLGGTPSWTIAGTAVTWSATNAGFNLATSDRVVIAYMV